MSKEFNENDFQAEVLDFSGSALVDFWAPWCGPCRMMSPIIDSLSEKYKDQVKIGKVNVDDSASIAAKYNIASIPTLIFFKNGEPVHTFTGATTESDLEAKIKEHLL